MDYRKYYNRIIENAQNRLLESNQYRERHHIIPRCMGGSDDPENIIELTPEEHYVVHQLLVKMYPNHKGLIYAAVLMTGHSSTDKRTGNKLYGWLRRKNKQVAKQNAKQRTGNKNSSYGRYWYYDPETLTNIKCKPNEVPKGYIKGRKLVPDKPITQCIVCGDSTGSVKGKYCDKHREENRAKNHRKAIRNSDADFGGHCRKATNEDIEHALLKNDLEIKPSMIQLGYKPVGYSWQRFKKIKDKILKENAVDNNNISE